jgi:hypothetical protein
VWRKGSGFLNFSNALEVLDSAPLSAFFVSRIQRFGWRASGPSSPKAGSTSQLTRSSQKVDPRPKVQVHKLRLALKISLLRQAKLHNIYRLLRKTLCLGTSERCCEHLPPLHLHFTISFSIHHDTQSCHFRRKRSGHLLDGCVLVAQSLRWRVSPHPSAPSSPSARKITFSFPLRLTLPHHFSAGNHADLREDPHGQDYHP